MVSAADLPRRGSWSTGDDGAHRIGRREGQVVGPRARRGSRGRCGSHGGYCRRVGCECGLSGPTIGFGSLLGFGPAPSSVAEGRPRRARR